MTAPKHTRVFRLWFSVIFACLGLAPNGFAFVITRTSSPVFYLDTSIAPQLRGMYVSYQINNNSAVSYPDIWVGIDSFAGGVISLAPNEDGFMHLGPLAPGQTKTAFFYLQASGETAAAQTHTVRIYPTRPPVATLATASFAMTSQETIQANANKVVTVVTGPTPPQLGGIVTMTVTGDGGTIGSSRIMSFSPAGYLDWRADAFEMISSSITLSDGNTGTYNDQLLIVVASSSATTYSAVYRFRAVNTTTAPTTVSPIAYISSGSPIKHTTTGTYGSIPPMLPTDNRLTVGKQASPTELFGPGTATFTLVATNSGTVDVILEDFVDTLPASPAAATYVSGSSRFNGSVISDPVVSGSALTWIGTFNVPAGSARALTFSVLIPNFDGVYTNRAVAHVGNTQIDTTLNTGDNIPAVAIVTVRKASVSGFVYIDVNQNVQKDIGENGTGLSLFAKLISTATPSGPAAQAAVVSPASGAYAFTNVIPGTYNIIIDNNNTLADVTPTIPPGWIGTEMPNQIRGPVATGLVDLPNQNFGLINGRNLTGRVFIDNGAGGGIANDGIRNGAEAGIAGVTVRLQDSTGATTHATATTDPTGNYALVVPAALPVGTILRVVETNPSGHLSTGASAGTSGGTYDRNADVITFTLAAAPPSGLDFGDVPENNFLNDSQQTGLPGSFVLHAHTYTVTSAGQLTLSVVGVPNPNIGGWTPVLYLDANCNAQLEPGEQPIGAPLSVTAGQQICILIKDTIPLTAPFNAQHQISITASFNYSSANPSLVLTRTRTALTIVGNPTTAGLTLTKAVDKNMALPGETITYTIIYANQSSEALNNIVVFDSTPPFTAFLSAAAGPLPANLSSVVIANPPIGGSGPIQWTFNGALAPGQSGNLTFRVIVSQ